MRSAPEHGRDPAVEPGRVLAGLSSLHSLLKRLEARINGASRGARRAERAIPTKPFRILIRFSSCTVTWRLLGAPAFAKLPLPKAAECSEPRDLRTRYGAQEVFDGS